MLFFLSIIILKTYKALLTEFLLKLSYTFLPTAGQAYEYNQIYKVDTYCIYNGDVDNSGSINLSDVIAISNDANNFVTGYKITDVTVNNVTNLTDDIVAYYNSVNFVSVMKP